MDPVEEFVQNLYNIEGITLAERRKNFNFLLRDFDKTNLTVDDLKRLDTSFQPRNILEEIFKLDLFVHLRYTESLFKIFECENLILIGRLVKCKWLFIESFTNLTSDDLIDLCKRLSPVTRGKILNKLASFLQNEEIAETYYESIKRFYGLSAARRLISACSINFVKNEFETFCYVLNSNQLLKIVKKDIEFIEFYFDKIVQNSHSKTIDANNYLSALHRIASIDFTLFLKLIDKYDLKMKLNRKLTRKLYERKKDDVIARPNYYLQIMNFNMLIRLLKDDFAKFYENSFPRSIKDYFDTTDEPRKGKYSNYSQTFSLINHLANDAKYNLITATFQRVYKIEIFKYPNFITDHFIEMMPYEERLKWSKQKMSEDRWICYLNIKDSIPLIKDKIKLFSDRVTRTRYLNYLVETCRINDDTNALLDVLRYYIERHRNEESDTKASFLRKLHNSFKIERLTGEHWVEILKLLKLADTQNFYFYDKTDIYEKYLLHLYQNDAINDESILAYLKDCVKSYVQFQPFDKHLKYRKDFYRRLPTLIVDNFKGKDLDSVSSTFLNVVNNWNETNPNDKIDIYSYPKLFEIYMKKDGNTETRRYQMYLLTPYLLGKRGDTPEKEMILHEFVSMLEDNAYYSGHLDSIIEIVLKNEPLKLLNYAEPLSKWNHYNRKTYLDNLKYYHHLGLPEKFKEEYLKRLTDDEYRNNAIRDLVHLMPTDEYVDLMSKYRVNETNDKFDLDDANLLQSQCAFVEGLKYADRYSLALPIVKQFCIGNYLKSTLATLYRIFEYTTIEKTDDLLAALFDRAVSVRKHAIFLAANTRDRKTVYNTLKEMGEKEKNPSLSKFIFKRTFKYFCANPSDEFFDLLKLNSRYIKKEDEEAYEYFYQYTKVPLIYLTKFIQLAWDCISDSNVDVIKDKRFTLLDKIDDDIIKLLPDTFCRDLLRTYLCTKDESSVREFACKYILASENDGNLRYVCDLLKEYVKSECHVKDDNSKRQIVRFILTQMCNSLRRHKKSDYLITLSTISHEIFDILNAYEEHLTIELNVLYLNANVDYKIRNFAERVYEFFDENVQKFTTMIVDIFGKILSDTLEAITWDDDYRDNHEEILFNFYVGLSNTNKSAYNYALILTLLPNDYSLVHDIKLQHQMILREISKCDEPWLKIRYNTYLNLIINKS